MTEISDSCFGLGWMLVTIICAHTSRVRRPMLHILASTLKINLLIVVTKKFKFFSVIFDETTDVSKYHLSGVALGHIKDIANNFDLHLKFCKGFGVDSCSVMASEIKGAIQELKKIATHAQCCPCNHLILNNSSANASKVVS
ncbi:hypothetical protein PR048_019080 [Dryococelus australis]|uniref:DUF4371 domain-containing protein n=1 Tax=Dryococelus australis TaxID=614101 RepID=A0ABQ9H2L4_9NEOP|nr:hypothetical protein PR048_019080 [Dryococelus australis]